MRTNALRKVGLVFLFGLGLFTMVAAVIRIISIFVVSCHHVILPPFHLHMPNIGLTRRSSKLNQESAGALWSIREDFIAVVVTQAPMVYPLFGRQFWRTVYGSGDGSHDESAKPKSGGTGESHELTFGSATMNRCKRPKDPYSLTQLGITQVGRSESQEEMIHSPDPSNKPGATAGGKGTNMPGNGTTVSVAASDNGRPGVTRNLSLKARKGRVSEKPHNNAVTVEHCVTTTVTTCPEEQKRRDAEAWGKQPWEA